MANWNWNWKWNWNWNWKRLIWVFVAFVLASILMNGISNVMTYFIKGAQEINKYDAGISLLDEHQPPIKWLQDDTDIGGHINPYLRKQITEAYIDAWGILNLSIRNNKDLGLTESFSDQKTKQLRETLSRRDTIIKEDLTHLLQLHFISYDKQVVSFSDRKAIVKTTLINRGNKSHFIDTSDYKVIMTLNDGKWRVDKIHRTTKSVIR